jgi:hypothetical protein
MKKNDVLLLIASLLFSGLFYKQAAGLNFPLFTLLLSAAIAVLNPEKLKDKAWWYYCLCVNLAGIAVLMINSALSVLAAVIGAIALSGKSFSPANSLIVSGLSGVYSLLSSPVHWVIDLTARKKNQQQVERHRNRKLILSIGTGLLAAICFFQLYRLSNPLFSDSTKYINLSWLNFGWIGFTFAGFLILHGLLSGKSIGLVNSADLQAQEDIAPSPNAGDQPDMQSSGIIAATLFALLNIMLLFLNGLDVANIYITQKLPPGISLSDFVHQAVWSTVFSIVIAVSLIAWLFRGNLNFSRQGKTIKVLVYLWILQSMIVVINTMVRNYWYVQGYQLTYLRIGVFVFLGLSLCGLVLTYVKLIRYKSAWSLFTTNAQVWFALLIFSSVINWDKTITRYNIQHASPKRKPDVEYMLQLSDANLPELVQLHNSTKFTPENKRALYHKILHTYQWDRFRPWQSYSLRRQQSREAMFQLKLKP